MNVFDIGDLVRVSATFKNGAGVATDPTGVALQVKNPDGEISAFDLDDVIRVSAGVYRYDLTIDMAGTWTVRWAATGAVTAAREDEFSVNRSAFPQ